MISTSNNENDLQNAGGVKVQPRKSHESPEVEKRYSSTLSLTSALDGMGGQRHAPAALPRGKRSGTHCIRGWVGPRTGADNLALTWIRSPDRRKLWCIFNLFLYYFFKYNISLYHRSIFLFAKRKIAGLGGFAHFVRFYVVTVVSIKLQPSGLPLKRRCSNFHDRSCSINVQLFLQPLTSNWKKSFIIINNAHILRQPAPAPDAG